MNLDDYLTFEQICENTIIDLDELNEEEYNLATYKIKLKIELLLSSDIIESIIVEDDRIHYYQSNDTNWSNILFYHPDTLEYKILLEIYTDINSKVIHYTTQKGKSSILASEIKKWNNSFKNVIFLCVDNDLKLADDTCDKINSDDFKIFKLASTSDNNYQSILSHIFAYKTDTRNKFKIPVIVYLANEKQHEKVLKLQYQIYLDVLETNSLLRINNVFDEFDKIYPKLRNQEILEDNKIISSRLFNLENTIATNNKLFISATLGCTLEYPEIKTSINYDDYPISDPSYRAFHLEDSIIKRTPFIKTKHKNNNEYLKDIFENNKDYFCVPLVLSSGEVYFRKVIANVKSTIASHIDLALWCNQQNAYAIVYNGLGLSIFDKGKRIAKIKTKFKNNSIQFNQILMFIYEAYDLKDKLLFIFGNRKVNRGITFHYAPQEDTEIYIEIDGLSNFGPHKITKNNGLIWTDMILGKINDSDTANQKCGRLAGKIANCNQFKNITFWCTSCTADIIIRKNKITDESNNLSGQFNNVLNRSSALVPIEYSRNCLQKEADTFEELKFIMNNLNILITDGAIHDNPDGFKYSTTYNPNNINIYNEFIKKGGSGISSVSGQRNWVVIPVYKNLRDKLTLKWYCNYI